jgi:hypothetical protein
VPFKLQAGCAGTDRSKHRISGDEDRLEAFERISQAAYEEAHLVHEDRLEAFERIS